MPYFKNHFGLIITRVIAFLMSGIMAVAVMFLNHMPKTWVTFVQTWGAAFLVVTVVLVICPVSLLGDKFAGMFKLTPHTMPFTLVSNIIPTLIINTVLAFVMPALGIFYNEAVPEAARMGAWLGASLGGWLPTFIISYFAALIAAKVGESLAVKTIGFPGPPQGGPGSDQH
ncbi:MAG: hypothetical protein IJH77_00555 [Mogibacterium sp.]|nr:hypothetical protein [Mogibacterium sp.]